MTRIAEIQAILADDAQRAALSADELRALEDELLDLVSAARTVNEDESSTVEERDAALAEATSAVETIQQIRAERTSRTERDADRGAAFDALLDSIDEPAAEDPEPDPEETEDPPAEGDDAGEEGGESTGGGNEEPAPAETAEDQEPAMVAAAAARRGGGGPSLGAITARTSTARQTGGPATPKRGPLNVTAEIVSLASGQRGIKLKGGDAAAKKISEAFVEAHERWGSTVTGVDAKIPVVHMSWEYPESHRITDRDDVDSTSRKLDGMFEPSALVATGGVCAPFPVQYDLLTLASDERPVRNNLPSVQAPRGGIRFVPPSTLSEIQTTVADPPAAGSAVGQYTQAMDLAGGKSKPHQTFACKAETSAQWYAITKILQFGNFNARTFPEQVSQWVDLTAAAQARFAETLLLQGLGNATFSTPVDFNGGQMGYTVALRAAIARAVRRYRRVHRIPEGVAMRIALPDWVRDVVREDMGMRLANGNEQFEIPDAWIDARIKEAGASPWYFIDGANDIQTMSAKQAQGPLADWPNTTIGYLYVEGTWVMLDGGMLDLGIVRDSTLNTTNDFQMFAETFEGLAFRGFEAQTLNMTLCANGASAGTYTPDVCGS